jgi:peptidoglycan hydrolase-like protein with peptidoglycan-binding domain
MTNVTAICYVCATLCDQLEGMYYSYLEGVSVGVHCWPNLKSGDSGTKVKALQHCLTHRGYTTAADGNFGLLTKTAVTNFQKVATPQDIDGIAGPKTLISAN